MSRSVMVLALFTMLAGLGVASADDTPSAYRDCIKDLEALNRGHWIDGGPHELAEGIYYSGGSGIGQSISGITPLVDPTGGSTSVYFLAYGKIYKANSVLVMPEKPSKANDINSKVKFFKVKSPVDGKWVFVRANAANFGNYTGVHVSSNSVALALNNETQGPKDPPTIELDTVGESEAIPFLEKQIVSVFRSMPGVYDGWLMNLKRKATASLSDSDIFRGSPAENAAFQEKLKKEYGNMLKGDYLSGLFPSCKKLNSKAVKGALSSMLEEGASKRAAYGGGEAASGGRKSTPKEAQSNPAN